MTSVKKSYALCEALELGGFGGSNMLHFPPLFDVNDHRTCGDNPAWLRSFMMTTQHRARQTQAFKSAKALATSTLTLFGNQTLQISI
jgi:hypothetical protein